MSTAPTRETGGDAGEVSSAASVQAAPAPRVPSPTTDIDAGKIEVVDGKPVWKPTRQFLLAFGSLCIVALAISFDATSLSVALPIISTALGGTALEAFWSGTSFLLATTVLQPTTAALSHIFGRKYLIYITSVLFAVGSLVAGLAHNFTVILVGRSLQGVGGGSLLALIEIVITDLVPLAFRPTWFSLLSAVWSVGTVTGPLIGAGFAQKVTWRWIFYINLPIIGLGLVAVALFLKQAKIPGGIVQKLRRFDWVGSALFTAASTGFLFGLTTGGVMYEWSSWRVLLPLIAGFLGVVVFGFWEMRYAAEPIIHRDIFVNRDMVITYVTTVMHGAILWSILYFLVLYYQAVKFYTPVVSAVAALPESLTVAPAAMLVGVVAGVTGRYRWAVHAGWVLATAGLGILMLLRPETTVAQWIFINIPVGLGTGMLFPAMTLTIQAACEPALNAEAAAFFSFLRTFGQSVGVAVSGVIFQNVFRQKLLAIPALAARADEYSRDATIVVGVIQNMAPSPERDALVGAFSDGLRIIWAALLAFAAFSLIISLGIKGYSLNQEHVTRQGLVVDEKEQKRREQEKKEDSV